MTINVCTDIHLGAPNALYDYDNFMRSVGAMTYGGKTLFSIGDNFDLANCKKSEVKLWDGRLKEFTRHPLVRHVDGNHERGEIYARFMIHGKVLLTHGDQLFWGDKKSREYRSKKRGASFLKRGIVVKGIEIFEEAFESKINEEFLTRAVKLCKNHYCETIVCGHKHNDKIYDSVHEGVRVIVLPRGFHTVTL